MKLLLATVVVLILALSRKVAAKDEGVLKVGFFFTFIDQNVLRFKVSILIRNIFSNVATKWPQCVFL